MSTEMAPKGASIMSDGALALANDATEETAAGGDELRSPPLFAHLPSPRPRLPTLEGLAPPGIADFDDPTNPDEAEWELTSELRAKPLPSQAEVVPTLPSRGLAWFASDERATEPMATEKLLQTNDDEDDLDDSDLTSVYVRPDGDDDDDFNDEETFIAPMPSDAVPTAPKQLPPLFAGPIARALPPPPRSVRAGGVPAIGVPARPSVLPPPPLGAAARASALPAGLLGMATRPAAAPPPPPPPGSAARPSALLPPPGPVSRAPVPPPPPGGNLRSAVPAPPTTRQRSVLPPAQLTRSSAPPPPPVGRGTLPPPPRSSSPPPALRTAPPAPRTPGWIDNPQNSPFAVRPLTAPVARPSAPPPRQQGSSIAPVALGRESFPTFATPFALPPKRLAQLGALALLVTGLLGAVVVLLKQPSSSAAGARGDGLVTVTVSGENGAKVSDFSVIADDVVRCTSLPCKVADLAAGTHFIRVTANGYTATAARAVAVTDDNQPTLHFQLSRIAKPVAATVKEPESAATEAAPQATTTPPIDLDADEASGSPSSVGDAPPRLASRTRARSSSHAKSSAVDPPKSRPQSAAAEEPKSRAKLAPPEAEEAAPAALSQLNISSTPSTSVVLDGRPLGQTPISGVKVSPGAHTIVFIGPDGKRKVGSATVKPGATRSIAVKF